VSFLADLAGSGPVLEFGVGTGRVAVPLSRRGLRVHGIDLSQAMVARLRSQPGGPDTGVTVGDFATTSAGAPYALVYLVRRGVPPLLDDRRRLRIFSTPHRCVRPSELDLMATLAGMRLRERWAHGDRSPFTSESSSHISVWEKPLSD
jgi:SAM-dependent methyltransferase